MVSALPRVAHIVMPLATSGSSVAHVVRAVTREHAAAGGSAVVVTSHNRPHDFPDAEVVEVDYTRHCPREYFTRNEYIQDVALGALLLERPHGARIFRPAAEALAGRDLDWVVLHEGHYAVTALPLLRRALPATTSLALHVHNPISRTCLRPELSHHLRRARLVLPVSDFVGRQIAGRTRAADATMHTVHNGADLSRFSPAADRPDDGRLRLLYVGQVAPHKGVHVLLGALARLGPESERLDVRIVGSAEHQPQEALSDYETSLRGLAARTDARVTFEPYTSQAEVARIYRWADVVVIPSLAEPFGMVAVEAMASGVLVLAAAAGGLPEVVGDAGVLVPGSEEAWVDALRTTDLARARAAREPSLRRAARFTWSATHERLTDLMVRATAETNR